MREIKFRYVWERPKTGAGPYSPSDPKVLFSFLTLEDFEKRAKRDYNYEYKSIYPEVTTDMDWRLGAIVSNFTVLISRDQYTGLKDKNGKEGYHKDLCQHPLGLYCIEWIALDAKFVLMQIQEGILKGNGLDMRYLERMEIVGNVWENPELKEGSRK